MTFFKFVVVEGQPLVFCLKMSFLKAIFFDEQVQVKDTVDRFVGNIPLVITAKSFSQQMDETELISEGSESGRRETSINDGTALFVVNVPTDSNLLEFQVS